MLKATDASKRISHEHYLTMLAPRQKGRKVNTMKSILEHFGTNDETLFNRFYVPTVLFNDLPQSIVSSFFKGLSMCGVNSTMSLAIDAAKRWTNCKHAPIKIDAENVKFSKNRSGIASSILTDVFDASSSAVPRTTGSPCVNVNDDQDEDDEDNADNVVAHSFTYDDVLIFNSREMYADDNKDRSKSSDVFSVPVCESNGKLYPVVSSFNYVRACKTKNDVEAAVIVEANELRVEKYYEAFMTYIISCGFIVDDCEYVYFCTTPSGFKTGKHIFVKKSVFEKSGLSATVARLRKISLEMKSSKWNVFRDEQGLALLTSNAVRGYFGEEFMKRIVVIDINDPQYSTLKQVYIDVDKAVNFEANANGKLSCNVGPASYEQAPADGFIPVNSKFITSDCALASVTNGNFDLALGAMRGAGVKGLWQTFDFLAVAKQTRGGSFVITDQSGVAHNIEDVSMILDKNAFKLFEQYVYCVKHLGIKSFYEFSHSIMGIDDIYLVNAYPYPKHGLSSADKKFNITEQFIAPLKFTDEFLAEITKRTFTKLSRFSEMSHEEFVQMAKEVIGYKDNVPKNKVRSFAAIADMSVNNGDFVYLDDIIRIVETAWYGIVREAMRKNEIDGAALKAVPFIPDYFNALAGEKDNFILDGDSVVCTTFKVGETLLALRNPCVAFDHWIGKNEDWKHLQKDEWHSGKDFSGCLSPCAIYTSLKSTLPKRLAADWDGDTINVTSNKVIVDTYIATEKAYNYYMLNFAESKGCLVKYENSDAMRGWAIARSWRLNKVGITAAIISHLWERANIAETDEERADIFNDISVYGQAEQSYVDASKRGEAYGIDYSMLKLSDDVYKDIRTLGMVGKPFAVQSGCYDKETKRVSYKCEKSDYEFNVCEGLDEDGFTTTRDVNTNFGKLFNYIVSRFPVFKYLLPKGEATTELKRLRDRHPNYAYLDAFSLEGNSDKSFKCSECFGGKSINRSNAIEKLWNIRHRTDGDKSSDDKKNQCKKMIDELVVLNGEDIVYSYCAFLLNHGSKRMNLEFFLELFGDKAIALAKERCSVSVIE